MAEAPSQRATPSHAALLPQLRPFHWPKRIVLASRRFPRDGSCAMFSTFAFTIIRT